MKGPADTGYSRLWETIFPDVWARVKVFHAECQIVLPGLKMKDTASALLQYALDHKSEVRDALEAERAGELGG